VTKEVPYLVLMTIGALNQVRAEQALAVSRALAMDVRRRGSR